MLWPLRMADAASRATGSRARSRPRSRFAAGSVIACGPRRHPGAGHVLSNRGNSKARRRSDAVPSCGVRRGWVGRSRGRHLIGDTPSLPPEMETPAFGGCRDRRFERPVQLRSTSFHGQAESAEPRAAFRLMHGAVKLRFATCPRVPAIRGGSAERRLPIVIRLSPRGAMVPC